MGRTIGNEAFQRHNLHWNQFNLCSEVRLAQRNLDQYSLLYDNVWTQRVVRQRIQKNCIVGTGNKGKHDSNVLLRRGKTALVKGPRASSSSSFCSSRHWPWCSSSFFLLLLSRPLSSRLLLPLSMVPTTSCTKGTVVHYLTLAPRWTREGKFHFHGTWQAPPRNQASNQPNNQRKEVGGNPRACSSSLEPSNSDNNNNNNNYNNNNNNWYAVSLDTKVTEVSELWFHCAPVHLNGPMGSRWKYVEVHLGLSLFGRVWFATSWLDQESPGSKITWPFFIHVRQKREAPICRSLQKTNKNDQNCRGPCNLAIQPKHPIIWT